jgi:hypothetical protein
MKKKGSRAIPDFSRHPPRPKDGAIQPLAPRRAAAPAPHPTVKPKATSAKSGRRGQ